MKANDFFDFPESLAPFAYFFDRNAAPWEWIPLIEKALIAYGNAQMKPSIWRKFFCRKFPNTIRVGKNVYIGKDVQLPVTCIIEDNVFIGNGSEIRNGALIRKNVIIGRNCVIGNSCEIKNSLIMDNVQIAHFNYVGDSILGSHVHLSAGAILSNLRFDQKKVRIKKGDVMVDTGLRKFGAILGEHAQIGCNAVLLPGTLLGRGSIVSVGTTFGGILHDKEIFYAVPNGITKKLGTES